MKKAISRNFAIISAIFIAAFSIMLITNYFQVRSTETIQSEVLENLKKTYEEKDDNPQLQEQIRELDLLARKAYFISHHRLKTGVFILLVMVVVVAVSLRIYFAKSKDIPDKEIDPIDDWLIKSKTRNYVVWAASALVMGGVVFALLTSPYLKNEKSEKGVADREEEVFDDNNETTDFTTETLPAEPITHATEISEKQENIAISPLQVDAVEISKVTHNGFRGNHSHGVSSAKNIPDLWDVAAGKNILWCIQVPRQGFNSPVINGNKLFFSGADEEMQELFCYELSTGNLLWRLHATNIPGAPNRAPEVQEDTGFAASTVATNGKQVCAIFASGDVICADMNGKQLWAKNIGIPDNHYGYASSLLIYGDLLFIQYDNRNAPRVIALDVATGNQRWMKERPERNPSWSSPIITTVNNKPQLVLIGNPGVSAYNPTTGEQYWRVECMSGEPAPGAASANGIVFVATEYANMTAINAADGSVLWKNNEFLPEIASPVAINDFVLIATTYGVVATFDAQTGEMIKFVEFNVEFNASPMIADGKVYLISTDGKVFVLTAKGDFSVITSFDTGEKTYATPAFTDKKIVIKGEKYIYCVGAR